MAIIGRVCIFSEMSLGRLKTTPPRIYTKLSLKPTPNITESTTVARVAEGTTSTVIGNAVGTSTETTKTTEVSAQNAVKTSKWGKGLLTRLKANGDSKLMKFQTNHIHIEPTRFIEPLNSIKGLDLENSLKQLKWNSKPISRLIYTELLDLSLKLKQNGFDLKKTFVAHGYVSCKQQGLQPRFIKMVKGRGRYGSTPHAKFSRLEWIFQERQDGFEKRLRDPLEKIRQKLRDTKLVDLDQELKIKEQKIVKLEINKPSL